MKDITETKKQPRQRQPRQPIPEPPKQDTGKALYRWSTKEFEEHERTIVWYSVAGIIVTALLVWSILSANYLFSIIIIITSITYYLQFSRIPRTVEVSITEKGIVIDEKLYAYESMRAFWVIYQPPTVNTLYVDFKNAFATELSIPLGRKNPVKIREILLDYMQEDLEKEDETTADYLRRALKL